MQLTVIVIIYFAVVRRLTFDSLFIHYLVVLAASRNRLRLSSAYCHGRQVRCRSCPRSLRDAQLPAVIPWKRHKCEKTKQDKKPDNSNRRTLWAPAPVRPRLVSIMEEWAVALARGLIGCLRRCAAFCRHHAKPLGLHQTPAAPLTLRRFTSTT